MAANSDKLVVTVGCDSSVSYPSNHLGLAATRENATAIAEEYLRCVDAGAAVCHLHGVRRLESEIQEDGRKLSRLDIDGWREMTEVIRAGSDAVIQFGIAGARFEDRRPLFEIGPDMMSVAFNAHDEHFQPDPEIPANCIYALHPLEELRAYATELASAGIAPEVEIFHSGAIWNLNKLRAEGLLPGRVWATIFIDWEGGSWTPPTEAAVLYMTGLIPEFARYSVSVMSPTEQWRLLSMVIGLGGHVRVGYEDNPYLAPGELADSNARLVERIVEIARAHGREIASPGEARVIIGLDG